VTLANIWCEKKISARRKWRSCSRHACGVPLAITFVLLCFICRFFRVRQCSGSGRCCLIDGAVAMVEARSTHCAMNMKCFCFSPIPGSVRFLNANLGVPTDAMSAA
jgi:hypothetical protein